MAAYPLNFERPQARIDRVIESIGTTEKAIPWKDNSSFATTFYSVLAAMVGAIMALAIGDLEIRASWALPIGLLSLSLVCFILGIEKYGEAVDEDDIDKYLTWLLAYNAGTAAMFLGIATYIALHYHVKLVTWLAILGIAFLASLKWWKDIWFLLFEDERSYQAYRQELLGERRPDKDRDWLIALHAFVRNRQHRQINAPPLPEIHSFTRLRPSEIHGVGVFAIRDIPKGTQIFSDDQSEMVWIDGKRIEETSGETRKLYDDFCVIKNGKYGCPNGFNNLTVSWYINEPARGQAPNVTCSPDYDFVAARDIRAGEELTVDYATYSEHPNPRA